MLDKLVGTKVFSKIDLKSRYPYHHIRMGTTKWAYKWLLMSCQLSNAPDTFMWDMTFSWDHLQLFILMINWYIIKLKKSCVKCWRLFTTETLCKLEEVIFLVPQSCVSWLCCLDRWITSRSWEGASYQRLVCATIHGQCLYWLASFYMRFHMCVCNKYQKFSAIIEFYHWVLRESWFPMVQISTKGLWTYQNIDDRSSCYCTTVFWEIFFVEWHRTYWGISLQVLLVGLGLG